ncbi:MAG: caspase family protein [Fimbriimonas sp.]
MTSLILLALATGSAALQPVQQPIKAAGLGQKLSAPRIRIVPQSSDQSILDIEESLDGSRLITHNRGYAPRLWDARKQILLTILSGHTKAVQRVNFSANGTRIVTLSADELRVWDSERAKGLSVIKAPEGEEWVSEAIVGDGSTVAIGSSLGKIRLFDSASGGSLGVVGSHTKAARCLSFSPDGKVLFSGSDDATGRLWSVSAKKGLWQAAADKMPIRWANFSADSSMVLVTSLDNKALLYKVGDGAKMQTYPHVIAERGSVGNIEMGAAFVGKKGDEVAACQANGDIWLAKAGAAEPFFKFTGHKDAVREMRVSAPRRYIGTYANDRTLKVWDTFERKEIPLALKSGNPMAGAFSPRDDVFWLGYSEGEIHRYDLLKGEAVKSTYGDCVTIESGELAPNGTTIWMAGEFSLFGDHPQAKNLVLDGTGQHKLHSFWAAFESPSWSPNSETLMVTTRVGENSFYCYDLWQNRMRFSSKPMADGYAWSPDGRRAAVIYGDSVYEVDVATGETIHSKKWPVEKDQGGLNEITYHPNGQWVVTAGHPGQEVVLWNIETGEKIRSLGKFDDLGVSMRFLNGGKRLFIYSWSKYWMVDPADGKVLWEGKGGNLSGYKVSADDSRVLIATDSDREVLDAATGKSVRKLNSGGSSSIFDLNGDGSLMLSADGTVASVWDVATGKKVMDLPHLDVVVDAKFAAGGTRIVTFDRQGAAVWDVKPGKERLASIVLMESGEWLVYDEQGRYDASDPNNVTGAYFVMEWEHGLEPISMPQLKGQFYEPGLLGKALGLDKDPLRDVPSLESLRLYPELSVKAAKPLVIDIQAKERDGGGIGKMSFYLNGKQFYSKKSSGYVQLDLEQYMSFLVPETSLPQGRGNVLSVTVTNENGDLTSAPVSLDVGVPASLKVPDVHIRALFVGVGDYPGTSGDLGAPPSDAVALGQAVKNVGEKLLPGKVEVQVLGTGEGQERPTRQNILKWFGDTAASASSSDIVLVFFAGHGVSKIGDRSDYFFLTSEADPSDVTTAMASTATISGEDLRLALSKIPANKQVVILDTCHSGAAGSSLLGDGRSVSGDYQRAWEAIRDTTGTWLLAGSAANQLSYESSNVDHGMLTYALLEAIDRASGDGLRKAPSGEMFVDVERWLGYAANRVESLKSEVGVKGIQQPEFRRSTRGSTFDIGVLASDAKGSVGLRPPKPVVILGSFQADEEDPLGLEKLIHEATKDAKDVKFWYDVPKHPNVYRAAGTYVVSGDSVTLKLYIQKFDADQNRKTVETLELKGDKGNLQELAKQIRTEVELRIKLLEKKGAPAVPPL